MKRHLVLAGKSLAAAGLTGIVLYVVGTATQHSWPLWPYWIFGSMLVVGGSLYFLGQSRPAQDGPAEPAADTEATPDLADGSKPGPAFTAFWRYTSDGGQAPGLMMMTHKGFSHPGYMRPSSADRPPYVRIGVLVACDPLGPSPTTSDLRGAFEDFLHGQAVWNLLDGLTYLDDSLGWQRYASNGRIHNEAVLVTSPEQTEAPVASAMLNLNEAGLASYGHDSRYAELVLHVEPRDKDGKPAQAAGFATWYTTLVRALAVPTSFARFLTDDAQVATYEDPPAQLGIELSAYRSLTELIDPGGLQSVPGSWQSNQFLGYVIAGLEGKGPGDMAQQLLTAVCDHALHLDGYESTLAALGYVCEVCGERIEPDARGKIRLEGVTHQSAPKAWVWGPVPVHEDCRLRLRTPYDDRVGIDGYIRTWQKMTA
jgi:hypothetical protein